MQRSFRFTLNLLAILMLTVLMAQGQIRLAVEFITRSNSAVLTVSDDGTRVQWYDGELDANEIARSN